MDKIHEIAADGVPARKVKRMTQSIGIDRMGASQVSRMCLSLN